MNIVYIANESFYDEITARAFLVLWKGVAIDIMHVFVNYRPVVVLLRSLCIHVRVAVVVLQLLTYIHHNSSFSTSSKEVLEMYVQTL